MHTKIWKLTNSFYVGINSQTLSNQRHRRSWFNGQPNLQTSSLHFCLLFYSEPFHSVVNVQRGSTLFSAHV